MVGTWEPAQAVEVTSELLAKYVAFSRELDLSNLASSFPTGELATGAQLMKLQKKDWQAADALVDDELVSLIRFFTQAEMQLTGWSAGKNSPVIYLVKLLKKRGAFDPELKQWIKSNTDNRYLPNGAVML